MGAAFTWPYDFYFPSGGIWVILPEISEVPLEIQARFSLAELTTSPPSGLGV